MGSPPSPPPPPPAPTAPPTPSLFLTSGASLITSTVGEGSTLNLDCGNPTLEISRVIFASYGLPDGSGLGARYGWCYAGNSQDVVQRTCLGSQTCSVGANNNVFGDPCVGTVKRLTVTAECTQRKVYATWTSVGDHGSAYASCAAGYVIDADAGSTYGNGNCALPNVADAVNTLCQGASSCTVPAEPAYVQTDSTLSLSLMLRIFGSDPCPTAVRTLNVKVNCKLGKPVDAITAPLVPAKCTT
ncbi:unnamed protein product [Aphanomyces euteiches]